MDSLDFFSLLGYHTGLDLMACASEDGEKGERSAAGSGMLVVFVCGRSRRLAISESDSNGN